MKSALHIEKYAADCLTSSMGRQMPEFEKYFSHRLLYYIEGHCLWAVPFSIENAECFGYNKTKFVKGILIKEI